MPDQYYSKEEFDNLLTPEQEAINTGNFKQPPVTKKPLIQSPEELMRQWGFQRDKLVQQKNELLNKLKSGTQQIQAPLIQPTPSSTVPKITGTINMPGVQTSRLPGPPETVVNPNFQANPVLANQYAQNSDNAVPVANNGLLNPSAPQYFDAPTTVKAMQSANSSANTPEPSPYLDMWKTLMSNFSGTAAPDWWNSIVSLRHPADTLSKLLPSVKEGYNQLQESADFAQDPNTYARRKILSFLPMLGPSVEQGYTGIDEGDPAAVGQSLGHLAALKFGPDVTNYLFKQTPRLAASIPVISALGKYLDFQKYLRNRAAQQAIYDQAQVFNPYGGFEQAVKNSTPEAMQQALTAQQSVYSKRATLYNFFARSAPSADYRIIQQPNPMQGKNPMPTPGPTGPTDPAYITALNQWKQDQLPINVPEKIKAPINISNTQTYAKSVIKSLMKELKPGGSLSDIASGPAMKVISDLRNIANVPESVDQSMNARGTGPAVEFYRAEALSREIQELLDRKRGVPASRGGLSDLNTTNLENLKNSLDNDIQTSISGNWQKGAGAALGAYKKAQLDQRNLVGTNIADPMLKYGMPGSRYESVINAITKEKSESAAREFLNLTKSKANPFGDRESLGQIQMQRLIRDNVNDFQGTFNAENAYNTITKNPEYFAAGMDQAKLNRWKDFLKEQGGIIKDNPYTYPRYSPNISLGKFWTAGSGLGIALLGSGFGGMFSHGSTNAWRGILGTTAGISTAAWFKMMDNIMSNENKAQAITNWMKHPENVTYVKIGMPILDKALRASAGISLSELGARLQQEQNKQYEDKFSQDFQTTPTRKKIAIFGKNQPVRQETSPGPINYQGGGTTGFIP